MNQGEARPDHEAIVCFEAVTDIEVTVTPKQRIPDFIQLLVCSITARIVCKINGGVIPRRDDFLHVLLFYELQGPDYAETQLNVSPVFRQQQIGDA